MEDAAEAIALTDVQLGEPWAAELRLKPCISDPRIYCGKSACSGQLSL
jgi:hypothetical protein